MTSGARIVRQESQICIVEPLLIRHIGRPLRRHEIYNEPDQTYEESVRRYLEVAKKKYLTFDIRNPCHELFQLDALKEDPNKKRKALSELYKPKEIIQLPNQHFKSPYTPNIFVDIRSNKYRFNFMKKLFTYFRNIPGYMMNVLSSYKVPPLVSSVPQTEAHRAGPREIVAALVDNVDYGEKVWMLSYVVLYREKDDIYGVADVDYRGLDIVYLIPRKGVVSLPHYQVNPETTKRALCKVGERIMAVYPGTTLFLIGIIEHQPLMTKDDYKVTFFHPNFPNGVSTLQSIPQGLVIPMSNPHLI